MEETNIISGTLMIRVRLRWHTMLQRLSYMVSSQRQMEKSMGDSTHLEKAKGALAHASEMDVELGSDKLPAAYSDLLTIAQVQAQLAQAHALERIADIFENELKKGGVFWRMAGAFERATAPRNGG